MPEASRDRSSGTFAKNMNAHTTPKLVSIIGWFLAVGIGIKLVMTPFTWPEFELWRNIFLTIMKCAGVAAGIFLIQEKKIGAFIYWPTVVLQTSIFYLFPPPLEGINRYFSPWAIALAILIPTIFTVIFIRAWTKLK